MVFNLVLRFLLEICVLIALAYWGIYFGKNTILKLILSFGAPVLIAVIWGIFGSPKALFPLNRFAKFSLEIGIFALAVVALYYTDRYALATVFLIIIIINQILLTLFNQR